MRACHLGVLSLLLTLGYVSRLHAEPSNAAVVANNLGLPTGVAVQPESGDIFVLEAQRGRVIRLVDGEPVEMIRGLRAAPTAESPWQAAGPRGFVFIQPKSLVISESGGGSTTNRLVAVTLSDSEAVTVAARDAIVFESVIEDLRRPPAVLGGLTNSRVGVLVVGDQGPEAQWLLRWGLPTSTDKPASALGPLQRFLPIPAAAATAGADCLAMSPRGEIVVGHRGEFNGEVDSYVSFFRSTDGQRILSLPVGLANMVAIAYGPPQVGSAKSPLLALDFGATGTTRGGLYRLDANLNDLKPQIHATRLEEFDRPTAMTLAADGSLLVTTWGPNDLSATNQGQLFRVDLQRGTANPPATPPQE